MNIPTEPRLAELSAQLERLGWNIYKEETTDRMHLKLQPDGGFEQLILISGERSASFLGDVTPKTLEALDLIRLWQQGAEQPAAITQEMIDDFGSASFDWGAATYDHSLSDAEKDKAACRLNKIGEIVSNALKDNRVGPTTAITEEQVEAGAEQITDDDDIVFIGQPIRKRDLFVRSENQMSEIAEHDRISDLAAACVSAVLEACAVDCENVDGAIDRVIDVIKSSRAAAME
jgi:hypothetical protein